MKRISVIAGIILALAAVIVLPLKVDNYFAKALKNSLSLNKEN